MTLGLPRMVLLAVTGVLVVGGGCAATRWQLVDDTGAIRCTIERGWSRPQVRQSCGRPTNRGDQPKVVQWSGCHFQVCSAPVDIYGKWYVMYGCDTRVSRSTFGEPDDQRVVVGGSID